MNTLSHKKCYARNYGAVDVPRYTILARPSSQGVSESSVCPRIIQSDQNLPFKPMTESVPSSLTHLVESTNFSSDGVPSQNVRIQPVRNTRRSYFTTDVISAKIGSEQSVNSVSPSLCQFMYEKTPVSRVNDLSRFNKIPLEFSLVAEEGLPHEKTYYVQLVLGGEVYHGSASNMKKAQHNVATMALERTRYPHPSPKSIKTPGDLSTRLTSVDDRKGVLADSVSEPNAANNVVKPEDSQFAIYSDDTPTVPNDDKCGEMLSKSVINEVQELAVKMGLLVTYDTVEDVPAPNTRYHISCSCGSLVTHGSASSKKGAKKDAATNMLASLKNMVPELANSVSNAGTVLTKKSLAKKKKAKSLVKNLPDSAVGAEQAELSCAVRLYQVQQARKGTLPVYSDIGDVCGNEFKTEVSIDGTTCTGVGRTKKLAKQDAARQMLAFLGFPLQSSQETSTNIVPNAPKAVPVKSALKKGSSGPSCDKKVTFSDPESHEVLTTHSTTCPRISSKDSRAQSVSPVSQPRQVQILKRPAKENLSPVCESAYETSRQPTSSPLTAHQNQFSETSCGLTLLSSTVNQNWSCEISSKLTSPCLTPDPSPCVATSFESEFPSFSLNQSQICGTSCELNSLSMAVGESHFCETSTSMLSVTDENKYSDERGEVTLLSSVDNENGSTPGFQFISDDKTDELLRLLDTDDQPATDRLRLIAASLCTVVQYTDVPKSANSNEYVSIVSVSTSPPLVNHGVGPTLELAREAACREALEMLRDLDFLKTPVDEVGIVAAKVPEC